MKEGFGHSSLLGDPQSMQWMDDSPCQFDRDDTSRRM